MILRFRIEAENVSNAEVEEELAEWATKFQHQIMLKHEDDLCGKWECTDDVVWKAQKEPTLYRGRMVLKFHLLANEHDWTHTETNKWCRACGKSIPTLWEEYPMRQEISEAS